LGKRAFPDSLLRELAENNLSILSVLLPVFYVAVKGVWQIRV